MDAVRKWILDGEDAIADLLKEAKTNPGSMQEGLDHIKAIAHLRTVPEGYALVPVEPTKAMLDAAEKLDWGNEDIRGNCCNMFMAMMAVADKPAPPKSEPL